MRISQVGLLICVLAISSYLGLPAVDAQVEYGTSAAAGVATGVFVDVDSDLNLDGTVAVARAELIDVVAHAEARMNKVSGFSEVTDVVDSNALTYSTFSWDTFTVTGAGPTTVTFVIGLDARLRASRTFTGSPVVVGSTMVVDVSRVNPTNDEPTVVGPELFVGSAILGAATGLVASGGLTNDDFDVTPISGGFAATLSGFELPIDIDATPGSPFSLRFRLQTVAAVETGVEDGLAIADLRDSLQLLEIETENGVDISRASGAPVPPVPLQVAPVLVVMLPTLGAVLLARRSCAAQRGRSSIA
jgi:hypothetical protein